MLRSCSHSNFPYRSTLQSDINAPIPPSSHARVLENQKETHAPLKKYQNRAHIAMQLNKSRSEGLKTMYKDLKTAINAKAEARGDQKPPLSFKKSCIGPL